MNKPRRRFHLEISVEGDTWEVVKQVVGEMLKALDDGPDKCCLVGGHVDCGYSMRLSQDFNMTHEKYVEELNKYLYKEGQTS